MKKSKTKIIPRHQYMLIRPLAEESRENENGLLIPDSVEKEQRAQGTVEAVSDDIKSVKVGDHVVYGAFAGEPLTIQEDGHEVELRLVHNDDVIAFIQTK